MGSSTKVQTIDGYIEEYSSKHNEEPTDAVQSAMCKEFMEYADERDTYNYLKDKKKGEQN